MFHRQATPPTPAFNFIPGSVGSVSDGTFYSQNASPAASVNTVNTTPPRSPVRQHGPMLLPKVRNQDQIAEPTGGPVRHRRTTSTSSSIGYGSAYSPYSRPASMTRRGSSPFNYNAASAICSPASTASYDHGLQTSTLNSPIAFPQESRRASYAAHGRSRSATAVPRHARSGSAGSIDESVITRFGFPTYRNLPSYVTSTANAASTQINSLPLSYSEPQEVTYTTTTTHDYTYDFDAAVAPAVQYPSSQPTVAFDSYAYANTVPTSSLLEYLTAPNPSPALVTRLTSVPRGTHSHFWWDIRNLRAWNNFNISTITSLPSVLPLLQVPVATSLLPTPARQNPTPESQSQLHESYAAHYAAKINAALKVSQGSTHMVMRAIGPQPGGRPQPDFVSAYPSDYEKTIHGDPRGRVVGLVKCYDQWNSGMRSESAPKKVLYLQGLAHLHRVMREHGCRYGFIITEIELLCVRCGGSSDSQADATAVNAREGEGVPLFGFLETSPPIRLSDASAYDPETGAMRLTAGLALWYLHMLAKENPFAGMGSWRMDVGGPAALTRQNVVERDEWMVAMKPQLGEKREAKRVRGWVWPEEGLSRRECGRGRRKN